MIVLFLLCLLVGWIWAFLAIYKKLNYLKKLKRDISQCLRERHNNSDLHPDSYSADVDGEIEKASTVKSMEDDPFSEPD